MFSQVRVTVEVERDGALLPDSRIVVDGRAVVRFGKITENDVMMEHPSISRYLPCVTCCECVYDTCINKSRILQTSLGDTLY